MRMAWMRAGMTVLAETETRSRLMIVAALLSVPARALVAQQPAQLPAGDTVAPSAVARAAPRKCFRAHPLPRCSTFWLTEFGVSGSLASTDANFGGALFTWELGLMRNRSARDALGAAVFLDAGDPGGALGLRPRYRRWLTQKTALDVAPGVVVLYSGHKLPAFSGQLALSFADYVALTSSVFVGSDNFYPPTQYDMNGVPLNDPVYQKRTRAVWFAGARVGAAPGAITAVGFPIAIIALIAILCSNDRCFD